MGVEKDKKLYIYEVYFKDKCIFRCYATDANDARVQLTRHCSMRRVAYADGTKYDEKERIKAAQAKWREINEKKKNLGKGK